MRFAFRDAHRRSDLARVSALIEACGLSTVGLFSPGSVYIVAVRDLSVVGVCGLEPDGDAGLLRSLAVDPSARGVKLSWRLVELIIARARLSGVRRLFTFSKDTGDLFIAMGWHDLPLQEVTPEIENTTQVIHYHKVGWYPDERALCLDLNAT
ncbi:GNAT family N-acetyltransferase [Caulobacter sp. UNC358MFTsu5.1]|uniref:GNAT family N-acetyltransferase n=1 Tax=Caulobacter sp. UNC358MFTsu5.1 TaxID=1449049 RepID=UPI00068D03C8|nr:GNAT family N-acetyltransferase [Caulobacter sp. UNC358MFTsu5.1]